VLGDQVNEENDEGDEEDQTAAVPHLFLLLPSLATQAERCVGQSLQPCPVYLLPTLGAAAVGTDVEAAERSLHLIEEIGQVPLQCQVLLLLKQLLCIVGHVIAEPCMFTGRFTRSCDAEEARELLFQPLLLCLQALSHL